MCHYSQLNVFNNNWFVCYSSFFTTLHRQYQLQENWRSSNYNYSLQNVTRLHTRLTKFLLTELPTLLCLLYGKVNSLMNILEDECSWVHFLKISINVKIVVALMLFVYFVYIYFCCVCGCVFVYLLIIFLFTFVPSLKSP